MKKEVNISPEVQASKKTRSAEPAHRTTSGSEAVRCEGEVEKDLTDALHQSVSSSQGTPPSNTVPLYINSAQKIVLE